MIGSKLWRKVVNKITYYSDYTANYDLNKGRSSQTVYSLSLMSIDSPVSDEHHFVHLYQLFGEERHHLQVVLLADLLDGLEELFVFDARQVDAGEEIVDDAVEQRDVMSQELG